MQQYHDALHLTPSASYGDLRRAHAYCSRWVVGTGALLKEGLERWGSPPWGSGLPLEAQAKGRIYDYRGHAAQPWWMKGQLFVSPSLCSWLRGEGAGRWAIINGMEKYPAKWNPRGEVNPFDSGLNTGYRLPFFICLFHSVHACSNALVIVLKANHWFGFR